MQKTSHHLSTRTVEVNQPAGKAMEDFCLQWGESLRNSSQPVELSAVRIADTFRMHFGLRCPVMPQLGETLDLLGIGWVNNIPIPEGMNAYFVYNRQQSKWELCVRDDRPSMESVNILHELYEILWWRCYYLIPEWEQWASSAKMLHPHDTADDFARAVVLPRYALEKQAADNGHNPLIVAGIFQTAPGYCFMSFLRLTFRIPYIQLRIDFDVKTDQVGFCFDDKPLMQAHIKSKGAKIRSNASKKKWESMLVLDDALSDQRKFVSVEDWIWKAVNEKRDEARYVNILFAISLPTPVYVVVRHNYNKAFVQIVPVGKEEMLLDATLRMHRQAAQAMALEQLQN